MSADQQIEVRLKDEVIAFDGRVVEHFGGGQTENERRLHVSLITKIEAKAYGNRLILQIKASHGGWAGWSGKIDPETLEQAKELVAAIRSATGLEVST